MILFLWNVLNTEHFRPKVTYYWLAYEWSNFVLACRKCNSDCKGTQFPTKKKAHALPSADIDHDLDTFLADCHILMLEDEDRLLLHPVLDNPAEHLDFQENGEVYAKNKSEKGQNSIEVYGLNDWQDSKKPKKKAKRKKLVLDRKRIVENVRESVKDAMNRYQINPNEAVLFYDIKRIHLKLLHDMDTRSFSAVRKACLENFKSFFVDKFTGHQEIILNKVYIKVIEDLNS